jgi:hypothetical protein
MTDFSERALSFAIISLMNERKRMIEAHNLMDPDDEKFEEIGSLAQEIDSVMAEFQEAYETTRETSPAYPEFAALVSDLR